jgi:hypothetical protein
MIDYKYAYERVLTRIKMDEKNIEEAINYRNDRK